MSDVERQPWPHDSRFLAGDDGTIVGPYGRILRPQLDSNGYLSIAVPAPGRGQARRGVHVVVCEAFHGPRPDGMEVAHENGVKADCRPANLRWATHADNLADRERHGTLPRGVGHVNAKLTEDDVRAIRAASGSQRSIAARFGISQMNVSFIVRRETWTHI